MLSHTEAAKDIFSKLLMAYRRGRPIQRTHAARDVTRLKSLLRLASMSGKPCMATARSLIILILLLQLAKLGESKRYNS